MEVLLDLFWKLVDLVKGVILWFFNKFMEISFLEKIIILNAILAVVAMKLPSAHHYIFESWFPIASPYPEYLIGSVFFMTGGIYLQRIMAGGSISFNSAFLQGIFFGPYSLIILNAILWLYNILLIIFTIYKHLGPGLVNTPYEILPGFYLSIVAPAIYLLLSLANYLFFYRD